MVTLLDRYSVRTSASRLPCISDNIDMTVSLVYALSKCSALK